MSGYVEVAPGVSVAKEALERAVGMALAAKTAAEVARVAEEHQGEAEGYGETAWNAETKTVLYVAGDWTDPDLIEADFLAIDGVDAFVSEAEGLPVGWCDAEVVYPDPAPAWVVDACADESVTAALPTSSRPASAEDVERHNRLLALGSRRADELEEKFARILEPILYRAGLEAARSFRHLATDHLTAAALVAAVPGVTSLSTMVALKPRPGEAERIADPDGEPAETLHVTLCYLGEVEGDLQPVADALRVVAASHAPLEGVVGGYGRFEPPGVGILLPDVPGLVELRVAVTEALVEYGIGYSRDHGFAAHLTVDADPEPGELEETLARAAQAPLHFDELLVVRGDVEVIPIPLTGAAPITSSLTAAGDWTAPAGDELLDVAGLVQTLRTKTDPVRLAFLQAVMTPTLASAGLSFDVTNPLIAGAIASTGQHITSIAETTQLNVMRIVRESYVQGLSIPDTALAIQAGMKEASFTRATMIARTELAGAVHAGSLAATRIVAQETGTDYVKRWMTAPGAMYPRHENYEGLDGQTVPLDGYFEVGADQLEYPGDPSGDPGEVINCRCTMVYDSPEGEQEADAESGPPDVAEATLSLADVSSADVAALDREVEATTWPSDEAKREARRVVAANAEELLVARNADGKIAGLSAAYSHPKLDVTIVRHLASAQRGAGTALMRGIAEQAAARGQGISLVPLDEARGFYEKLGMSLVRGRVFEWTPEQVRLFAAKASPREIAAARTTLSSDPRVAAIQTALGDARGLTADEVSAIQKNYGQASDLVGINGYANRDLRAREAALRDAGGKIAAEVDRRVGVAGVRTKKQWQSVAKRRETAYAKSRAAIADARADAEQRILARDFAGSTVGQLSDAQYDALYLKVSLDPEVTRLSGENQARLESLLEARRAAETGGKELALARRQAVSDLLGEIGRGGSASAPQLTAVESDRALWFRLYDLKQEYATQSGSYGLADARKVVADASALLPRTWVEASDAKGPINVVLRDRGNYWSQHDVLSVSFTKNDVAGDPAGFSTALHELGHRMEDAIPEIRAWEWAFWTRRTVASEVEINRVAERLADLFPKSGYEANEMTYSDEFTDPYIGKTYGGNGDSSYEVLSMGLEGVFNGEHDIWDGDADLRNFVLALLAKIG